MPVWTGVAWAAFFGLCASIGGSANETSPLWLVSASPSCRAPNTVASTSSRSVPLDAVAAALDVTVYLDARWDDGDVDRLIDRAHARIVEHVVRSLRASGWEVLVEYGFNHYGDRGSGGCARVARGDPDVVDRRGEVDASPTSRPRSQRSHASCESSPDSSSANVAGTARHLGRLALVMPGTNGKSVWSSPTTKAHVRHAVP